MPFAPLAVLRPGQLGRGCGPVPGSDTLLMQMTTKSSARAIVPLVEGECDEVHVVRIEGDRFFLTAQQAIDALSLASQAVQFQRQFSELLQRLYVWVNDRRQRLSAAYISISVEGLTLLVVQRNLVADFPLEDELVDLDIEVANDEEFNLVPFNTLLIPRVSNDVLKSFLSTGRIWEHQVNAERAEPPIDRN